jgi:hypothetical protein
MSPAPCPSWIMSPVPPGLAKENDKATYLMNPPNIGRCSVSASLTGDLHLILVAGDGSVTVQATKDNPVGTITVTRKCPAPLNADDPAECELTLDTPVGVSVYQGSMAWEVLKTIGLVFTLPMLLAMLPFYILCWLFCLAYSSLFGKACDCDKTKLADALRQVYEGLPQWLKDLLK